MVSAAQVPAAAAAAACRRIVLVAFLCLALAHRAREEGRQVGGVGVLGLDEVEHGNYGRKGVERRANEWRDRRVFSGAFAIAKLLAALRQTRLRTQTRGLSLSIYLFIYLSIYLYPFIYLSIHLFIYSVYLLIYQWISVSGLIHTSYLYER